MPDVPLTWLGHATFRFDTPGGKRVYVDPWLENPNCPDGEKEPERVDLIALTHGHDDHVGQTLDLAEKHSCPVVALVELRGWLSTKGLTEEMSHAGNKGGTLDVNGIKITFTNAHHSSSAWDDRGPIYLGEPAGLVIEADNGTKLYFAGDTCVFGDMQLIGRIYEPDVAILPIGDHFTMGPREAAVALELPGRQALRAVPLRDVSAPDGYPGRAPEARPGRRDPRARAGRDGRSLRERWFGSTKQRVPELAVEGEIEFPAEPLVLDAIDDKKLRKAHDEGKPVVVRADSEEKVVAALARPEVASVLVPPEKRELLEIDLVGLTYG